MEQGGDGHHVKLKGGDYDAIIRDFLRSNGIQKVIAFSGGSNTEITGIADDDPLQAQYKEIWKRLEARIIGDCLGKLRGYPVAVLCGGTVWGVPKTAAEKAKEYDFKTIGVYPLTGKKHALDGNCLDLALCIEPRFADSQWGDESPIYTKLADAVVVFGGGAGTLIECAHILKINEKLIKNGTPPKYIVPIHHSGGVADGLPFMWSKQDIRAKCMPKHTIETGFQAADFIREKLNLDDYIET